VRPRFDQDIAIISFTQFFDSPSVHLRINQSIVPEHRRGS
jgi:hypothetical protein